MTREPEWDDRQRHLMMALREIEDDSCSRCGTPSVIADDPDNHVMVHEPRYCAICKGSAQYERLLAAQDKDAEDALGKDPEPLTPRPSDGRTIVLRPATPTEIQAAKKTKGGAARGNSS